MIILAKNAGFCFGVKRAVEAVEKNIDKNIVTLGPLIHNKSVVMSFEERGVRCVLSIDEVGSQETVVIRSHGVSPSLYEDINRKGLNFIDTTCPFVKRIHERVSKAKGKGLPVIIIGELGHPEVTGILGWAGDNAFVVYSTDDVKRLPSIKKAVVVAQTTITQEKWDDTLHVLKNKIDKITPFMSICSATKERQNEARDIAGKSDTIIVVGDKFSSNTKKLYELCKRYCKNVYHIEDKSELLLEKISYGGIIGIVAGASTPDSMIREVFNYMIENGKVLPAKGDEIATETDAANDTVEETVKEVDAAVEETVSSQETDNNNIEEQTNDNSSHDINAVAEESAEVETKDVTVDPEKSVESEVIATEDTAETVKETEGVAAEPEKAAQAIVEEPAETEIAAESEVIAAEEITETVKETEDKTAEPEKAEPATEQDEFLEGLEKVIRLKRGQLVKGNIVQITDEDVCVNIGYKSDGIIHKGELSFKDASEKEALKVGNEIEAEVVNLNDGEGNVLLSRRRVEKKLNWVKMQENVGTDKLYKCVVFKAVKGGVTTKIEGYGAFIPASHLSLKYIEDLKQFEGQEIEVTLIDADKRQERLVASHKSVLIKEKREKDSEIWKTFVKGEKINGVVKRLTDFGAFVDVGGVDGLLHISDLAWSRVKHPSDIVSEGQEIELLILNVDEAKKKIALGYKQLQPKPWDLVPEKYHEGDVVTGKIVRIVPFGAFVQLEPTVDGLVHISQITTHRLERVEDELRLGDEIEVKILEVNADKRKISLSRKALLTPEETPEVRKKEFDKEDSYKYELPPVQESTVSLADFFPKDDE